MELGMAGRAYRNKSRAYRNKKGRVIVARLPVVDSDPPVRSASPAAPAISFQYVLAPPAVEPERMAPLPVAGFA